MTQLMLLLLGLYGFRLSRQASANIQHVTHQAAMGSATARSHFTQTRYARVFGVKNSDLGILWFVFLTIASLTGLIERRPVLRLARVASLATAVLSLYLFWALLFRLRARCVTCLKSHTVNLAVLILLLRYRR